MKIDLHSHTTASDGQLSPAELVVRAAECQIDVLSITDHDTVSGLAEAHQTIKENQLSLKLINGIEISTVWEHRDIHIVGLNIDDKNPALEALIQNQKQKRLERTKRIAEKLDYFGFPIIFNRIPKLHKDVLYQVFCVCIGTRR